MILILTQRNRDKELLRECVSVYQHFGVLRYSVTLC